MIIIQLRISHETYNNELQQLGYNSQRNSIHAVTYRQDLTQI